MTAGIVRECRSRPPHSLRKHPVQFARPSERYRRTLTGCPVQSDKQQNRSGQDHEGNDVYPVDVQHGAIVQSQGR